MDFVDFGDESEGRDGRGGARREGGPRAGGEVTVDAMLVCPTSYMGIGCCFHVHLAF
jgi:hypothetical protein